MALHGTTTGSGPDLVLLHGWGLHGGIFAGLARALSGSHRVTYLDLPGHGRSPFDPPFHDLDSLTAAVEASLPEEGTLLGWSLGGMVALRLAAARTPGVRRLVLVATTPRFVAAPDWPHGLGQDVVEEFARQLAEDHDAVLSHFLTLQARGDDRQRSLIRDLRTVVASEPGPDPAALAAGLRVLRGTDLRADAGSVDMPTLVVAGEYDRLTRPGAALELARRIPGAQHVLLPGASHAPFLSHPEAFLRTLEAFLGQTTQAAETA